MRRALMTAAFTEVCVPEAIAMGEALASGEGLATQAEAGCRGREPLHRFIRSAVVAEGGF
jgi:hypothetical protein